MIDRLSSDRPPSSPENSPDHDAPHVDLYTVGHSTRTIAELIDLLTTWQIDELVDIRSIPYSSYNPQFNREAIEPALRARSIEYRHDPDLAGPTPDRETMGRARTCAERSVGYETWLDTERATEAMTQIDSSVEKGIRIAMMCGEIRPENCHRFRLASRLDRVYGRLARHLIGPDTWTDHPPTLI